MKQLQQIICLNCKHKWKTKSKLNNVTCPSCQRKVKIITDERRFKNE